MLRSRNQAYYESTQPLVTRVSFFPLLFRNFDDRLSTNCHMFVTLCILFWDTPSEKTGLWQNKASRVFKGFWVLFFDTKHKHPQSDIKLARLKIIILKSSPKNKTISHQKNVQWDNNYFSMYNGFKRLSWKHCSVNCTFFLKNMTSLKLIVNCITPTSFTVSRDLCHVSWPSE